MRPQRLALCVIGGMVTVAAAIVIMVLARDRGPSTPSLEGKQLTSSAAIEVSLKPTPKAGPDTTKPETQEDPHPAASNNETATAEPDRSNLGHTLADVEDLLRIAWMWEQRPDDGDRFSRVATSSNVPGLKFLVAGPSGSPYIDFIAATIVIWEELPTDYSGNILMAAFVLSQLSDWDTQEVSDWVDRTIPEAIAVFVEDRQGDASTICQGRHQLTMWAWKVESNLQLVIGLSVLTPDQAADCEQWQPDTPKKPAVPLTGQVQTKTVERNEEYHKVSYTLTITNNTADPLAGIFKVQWLDSEGFVLVEELVIKPSIAPGENTFRGSVLIDTPLALKVARTVAEVTGL